jgi:hypothetical protein
LQSKRPDLRLIKNDDYARNSSRKLKEQYLAAKQTGDAETYYKVLRLYNALLLRENEI